MAEEANENHIEAEATKGRKDEVEEGRVGRKGESLESEEELAEETAEDAAVVGGREVAEESRPEFEVRRHKTARRPLLPTKAEIGKHYPLHLNYRSRCKDCVAGKARTNQHVQSKEEKVRLVACLECRFCFYERRAQ